MLSLVFYEKKGESSKMMHEMSKSALFKQTRQITVNRFERKHGTKNKKLLFKKCGVYLNLIFGFCIPKAYDFSKPQKSPKIFKLLSLKKKRN